MHAGVNGVASRKRTRRDAIVEVAMRQFSERPYEEVLIDDVCSEAGVAHGLVSYYFGGKRGLFTAAVRKAWQDMIDYEKPHGDESAATDRVHGYIRRHFEYVQLHASRFSGLMHSKNADPEIREIAQAAQSEALIELMASLGCPVNPPTRLRVAIMGWAGFLDSVTADWLNHRDLTIDDIVELTQEALIAAVRLASGNRFDDTTREDALIQVSRPTQRSLLMTSAWQPGNERDSVVGDREARP